MDKKNYGLLSRIDSPADLRKLSIDQLPELCRELRQDIIDEVSDRIVWDVGHQAYGHKILTGRRETFNTNRQFGGIRPFPSPEESEYDTFTCGHASNSISAALGMAVAARKTGKTNRHVVAVIGDGAMSGGLAFEGLNNVSSTPNDLLVVLNDNDMSIDRAVGGMEKYLINLDTNDTYNRIRFKLSSWMRQKGYLNDARRNGLIRFNNALKSAIAHQQNLFEGMNIRYFGPFNGHDVINLINVLRRIKDMKGPKLLHLHTVKGKGYKPAEEHATIWHAPGKFDAATGERIVVDTSNQPPKFQDVFGNTLLELARKNPRIVGVTPAMPSGCSMCIMMKEMPDRCFDVGIAEGHAVTFSGGMAKDGLQPFCNIYSAFAQRAYDNIIHDLAILNLPVVLCLDRSGLVGQDGPTHHGAFDMAALRPTPNLTISSPMDEWELRKLMYTAQLPGKGTFVIRYPRGRGVKVDWKCDLEEIEVGTGRRLHEGKDVAVLTIGPIGNDVENVIHEIEKDAQTLPLFKHKPSIAHYDMRFVKPLDDKLLREIGNKFKKILTLEDGAREGGFGSAVLEWMEDNGFRPQIVRMGLPDEFVPHGSVEEERKLCHLDPDSIKQAILELCK